MRIREFSITRYGPLADAGRFQLAGFNLIFGKNEYGKTLTIDAILRFLLGRNIKPREFERIERVTETPEGYLILEDQEGGQIKLPERGTVEDFMGLTPADCRNIFVIRDSDLSIYNESGFYAEMTDRLTGLRTKEISLIKEGLRRIGGITPSGMFVDNREEKLKTRIENAGRLAVRIEEMSKRAKAGGFDEFEFQWEMLSEAKAAVSQKIKDLEDARKRERLEAGENALENLKGSLANIRRLIAYDHDDKQFWRDCEKDIQRYGREKEEMLKDLAMKRQGFKETNDKLDLKERDFIILEERKKIVDEEIRPQIKNYERDRERLAGLEKKAAFFSATGKISVILFGLSLLGIFLMPSPFFYILSIIFITMAAVSSIFVFWFVSLRADVSSTLERINLTLSRFGLESDSIEGINLNIQGFGEMYSIEAGVLKRLGIERDGAGNEIKRLEGMVSRIEKRINDIRDRLAGLRKKSGEDTLEGYSGKLEEKKGYEEALRENKMLLESLFGSRPGTIEDNISYWADEIRGIGFFRDKAIGIKYDENALSKLKDEEGSIKEKVEELGVKITHFKKDLDEIEREANKIIQTGSEPEHGHGCEYEYGCGHGHRNETPMNLRFTKGNENTRRGFSDENEYIFCRMYDDLIHVRNRLSGFVMEREKSREAVLNAISIFEEIETEEKGKIIDLFGKDSNISHYFKGITDGLYDEVLFSQETSKIEVKRKDGVILDAGKLSGGAYDQLYLSVRIALGEKLLKGEKGFFIMDDPFIKSDAERLQNQIRMLDTISKSGWQVIYFSAKEEIIAALNEKIKAGLVSYNVLKIQI
ncbi:AAA family ATPase [bacterium]|nr:AAA family ATPase [bacterium]